MMKVILLVFSLAASGIIYSQSNNDYWFVNEFVPTYVSQNPLIRKKAAFTKVSEIGGKFGVKDSTGNILIPFKYDRIPSYRNEIAIVVNNEIYGAYNTSGKELIPLKFRMLKFLTDSLIVGRNVDSIYIFDTNGYLKHQYTGELPEMDRLANTMKIGANGEYKNINFDGDITEDTNSSPEIPNGKLGYYYSQNIELPTGGKILSVFQVESKTVSLKGRIEMFDFSILTRDRFNCIAIIRKGGYFYFVRISDKGYTVIPIRLKSLKSKMDINILI